MVHVIKACADQAEAINVGLPGDGPKKGYHLLDILPGGEKDLTENKFKDGLSKGSKIHLSHLIGPNSPAYDTIDTVVWKGAVTVFNCSVVCSVW